MPNCNDLWIDNKMTVQQVFLSTQKVEFSLRYDFLKSNALRILERRKYFLRSLILNAFEQGEKNARFPEFFL